MSRIGRLPVVIPSGVEVLINAGTVEIKGPKGKLAYTPPSVIAVAKESDKVICTRQTELRREKALHGLVRNLINNMVIGVTKGFTKVLEIQGVGYRAKIENKQLVLNLGFSHPVEFPIPEGIDIKVEGTNISVSGIDKQKVGAVSAKIRGYYPPEPYKGKGIRYSGEFVRRKAGKTVGK